MPLDREGFGARVREFRTLAEMTQDQLAKKAGLSRPSITNIERGRQDIPASTLLALAEALGVTPNDLLGFGAGPSVTAFAARVAGQQRRITQLLQGAAAALHELAQASDAHAEILAAQGLYERTDRPT
jgi:transcriptional regulator with XRE-family HTH domain